VTANLQFRVNLQRNVCIALFIATAVSRADWVAFNDNTPGPTTHPNATTNNIRLQMSGPLKDITTGTNLPVTLAITHSSSGLTYSTFGLNPVANTPLYNSFNGFVVFGAVSGATDANVELTNGALSTVTYSFSGLNPAKRYSFKGGAIRGLSLGQGSNRWTRVEIAGATSFTEAHSSNVVTSAQAPVDLAANQVAVNFAANSTPQTGDMVDWEDIAPAQDGSFAIICSQYQGFVPTTVIPGGGHSNGTNAYAITGIRLEELPAGPPSILVQPENQTANSGQFATFSVSATGLRPLSYQWYRNGSAIAGATNSNYATGALSFSDYGRKFFVTVSNSLGFAVSSNAMLTVIAPPIVVLALTNTWKYEQSGTDLGTAWRAPGYDDSSWPSGPGVLAAETDNGIVLALTNTVLSLRNPAGVYVTTFYFRTHFTLADDPLSISLIALNLIDDAAIIYLNGNEIYRQNFPPPPSPVTYSTLASSSIEAAWTRFTLPTALLVQGDNVLAVEVHQAATTSSDIVWGATIRGDPLPPSVLSITNNPTDRVVTESSSTTFSVGFSGTGGSLQWYKWMRGTAVPISEATRQNFTITNVSLSDAGFYFVVVSNVINQLTSAPALLTVLPDNTAPRLATADGGMAPDTIVLSFSEGVLPSTATNPANYYLTNLTSGRWISVVRATLTNDTNVLLRLSSPRASTENYLLIVNHSPHQNTVTSNSAIPISSLITLIGMDEPGWDFYNPVLGPPYEPFEPAPNWNELDFEVPDSDWGRDAAGLFAYNPSERPLPAPVNTVLSGGAISSYFRFPFDFSASPVGARLSVRQIAADGAATYFNGDEVYRYNLPTGPLNAYVRAATSIDVPFDLDPFSLPQTRLRFGTNVLAAELHSFGTADNSLAFGAELTARILSWARGPVVITSGPDDLTVQEDDSAELTFVAVGASEVQWQTNGVPVEGARTDTLTLSRVALDWDGMLVHVLARNESSSAISTNARLHVVPDLTPPRLLKAQFDSGGILLTFSEPLWPPSAINVASYQLTNSVGGTFAFSGTSLITSTNVLLNLAGPLVPRDYRVIVNGVRDDSHAHNEIAANTSASIGFDLSIPIDAIWRFFANNVDLGTGWRQPGYNDTDPPWSSGRALIADETAPLPEPIRTPISRLDNGTYHYTFYFRHCFTLPFGVSAATVTLRHIIDDGAIFYINGTEFHRFNMADGAVNYLTQATTNVGDAVYSDLYTITVTNLVAGDNVIAVEVHQSGTASSDVTFGAELSLDAPSIVFPGTVPPSLQISRIAGEVAIIWGGTDFTLEQTDSLTTNAVWTPASNQSSPFLPSIGSSTQFYRLRQQP